MLSNFPRVSELMKYWPWSWARYQISCASEYCQFDKKNLQQGASVTLYRIFRIFLMWLYCPYFHSFQACCPDLSMLANVTGSKSVVDLYGLIASSVSAVYFQSWCTHTPLLIRARGNCWKVSQSLDGCLHSGPFCSPWRWANWPIRGRLSYQPLEARFHYQLLLGNRKQWEPISWVIVCALGPQWRWRSLHPALGRM